MASLAHAPQAPEPITQVVHQLNDLTNTVCDLETMVGALCERLNKVTRMAPPDPSAVATEDTLVPLAMTIRAINQRVLEIVRTVSTQRDLLEL